ncbi:hypothetical protein ACIODS_30830 [Micromonospora chalcea]|uniref:GlsB/YeaQ/YmgE family stress response membrane protein n=2 Tax=Micromonospora chalcea TaxID=1874 RepID=A0ABX9Y791_MICCH|nr:MULTISPECIES: hypothetical protein [Micromonospora]EWM63866.1 hypothetical protein MCBG_00999 [Micromonospora sp. M42]MBC8993964.1 hypothetical protein [Micromonospora chalcea]MBP1783251.1 putative membrane protein YeaQ/YmgE (transglycosylase-associated protein family) [Micromonospora sp. HB375]MBQ1062345.1 hypothetical protein [Micromonospora sp. C41]MBQ1066697.1 hypothetical protein [Micromonospora sp. D75]
MTGSTLVGALVVGLAVGGVGRLVVPGRKAVPVWLTLALGVAAALLGAIVVGLVDRRPDASPLLSLVTQTAFAAVAVVLAVVTAGGTGADRQAPDPGARRKEEV